MRPSTRYLIAAFLVFILGCNSARQPQPVPASDSTQAAKTADVPVFDGKKSFEYLVAQCDFGPRVPNTPAHEKCLAWMQKEVQQYADAVNLQPFTHTGYEGQTLSMTNLIASFNLKATTRILLLAHWDSRPRADQDPDPKKRNQPILGANDGASGVAVLMEIARHLKEQPPAVGVDMLFDDGEDYGKEGDNANYLLGARYFADHLPQNFHPYYGILLDMVGDKELEIMKEPYSIQYAPDVVNLVWSTAKQLGVYQFSDREQRAVLDDHLPLDQVGIRTIDLIDFQYPDGTNRYWHTTADTPDKCSAESLEAVGKVLMYVIYRGEM